MNREKIDSGVEWIGKIPSTWKIERLQWHLDEINEKNNPVKTTNILSLTNKLGVVPYSEKGNRGNSAKENYDEYKIAYPNTIVANSMNILIGSVSYCNYFGCVSPVYYVFKNKEKSNLKYWNYIFQTQQFQKELRKYANGILEIRLRVSSSDILKREVVVPNVEEQQKIVEKLDKKISQIDKLIANQENQIEKIEKYRIQKIKEIYKKYDCQLNRISSVTNMVRGPFGSDMKRSLFVDEGDDTYLVYVQSNVLKKDETIKEGFISKEYYEKMIRFAVKPFDVLVTCDGTLGKIIQLSDKCIPGVIGSSLLRIRLDRSISYNYFKYIWTYIILEQILKEVRNSCLQHLPSADKLGKYLFKYPSLAQQEAICSQFDELSNSVDRLIDIKKKKIDKLYDYKKSLIYEYVTGKKEVI